MQNNIYDILIIGGGATGFFAAINAAEMKTKLRIAILERSNKVLAKVKVSGGGRCNVTHAEFDPRELVTRYPRGEKELLGPFHKFMTGDTVAWFEKRGVELKIEPDGRMFPVTNNSQTIIDCFLSETRRLGVEILFKQSVVSFILQDGCWKVVTKTDTFITKKILVATGSNTLIWNLLKKMEHTIIPPVPSLFTFKINDIRIKDLPGVATDATVYIIDQNRKKLLESTGPLLITHWGMSGPAILKLSAWGARILESTAYDFMIEVNWLEYMSRGYVLESIKSKKETTGKKFIYKDPQFDLPKRLWWNLVQAAGIETNGNWADLSKSQMQQLTGQLTGCRFEVKGKSTFKEEFVTAGGVELSEIDFRTFESKLHPGLYMAGEVINVDAITGGFNFQNAWTGGFLAAKSMTDR